VSNQLSIQGVSRVFISPKGQPTQALTPVDFEVRENDFVTILGPSGCGKSTLLRIVAGLDQPTTGQVLLDGVAVQGPGADRGMVFQSYTLFPWLNIEQNIRFGLRERGMPEHEQKERSDDFIAKVGLRGFEQHFPKQLSGGMQQRTAIARALANDPKILLMRFSWPIVWRCSAPAPAASRQNWRWIFRTPGITRSRPRPSSWP
jgi:ABC-type nitrate/sulfonate/bicarbonate transport system ATPase subunit